MENMVIDKECVVLRYFFNRLTICLLCSFFAFRANAFEWQFRPNFSLSEVYSDNLNLSNSAKISGFVTQVMPGVIIRGQSPWNNFNLNYRLQGLENPGGDQSFNIYHQLQMNSLLQPVRNTFFINTSASISQQNVSNAFLATDNISGVPGNRVNNQNFNITPYFTPHFGQYATGLMKVGYSRSFFSDSAGTQTQQLVDSTNGPISGSETFMEQFGLTSGTHFNVVSWGLNYSSQTQTMAGSNDVRFENYYANGRYFIDSHWNLFAQAGYENNYYATQANTTTANNNLSNGLSYTAGVQWKPSAWYSLAVGGGNNSYVSMQYNPSNNLSSSVTYNYRTVGLNLGSVWNANLSYSTPKSRWMASYQQETQTIQQILAAQSVFTSNPLTQLQTATYVINLPSLVNDVLISRTGNLSFNYRSGKSAYNATIYNTRRTYQLSQEQDTLYGASAGWQWQMVPRLTFFLQPLWQSTASTFSAANNDLYEVTMGLTRGVPINLGKPLLLNSTLEFRHIQQISSNFGDGFSYTENRATASFYVQY